ncbi:MAG: GAF domain-containing protein [Chloroflexi bacterium]|nr:GAF domain-containing protein [Chloroflexota bacterium]
MPPFFWLDLAAYAISTVIATALALTVLGAEMRRALNRLFALFLLAEAAWAISCLLLRIALSLQIGNPAALLELTTAIFALMGPLLLLFTVRYVSDPTDAVNRIRQANLTATIGLAVVTILLVPLFRHQIIFNPHLHNGVTFHDISALGIILATLPILYMLWSLALFWQERHRTGEPYMAMSVLVMLVGFAFGGLSNRPFPMMSITTTISIVILGYGVIVRQLFNPLRELTEKWEQRVEERTKELELVAAQLSVIHALGQKLVLSESTEEITRLVIDAAQLVLHVPICGIWLVDKQQRTLVRWAHTIRDQVTDIPPLPLDSEQGIIASSIRSKKAIYLPDVSQDPRYVSGGFKSHSELCVPLVVGSQVLGAMNAESGDVDAFSLADRQLLEALASSAAIAIENARFLQERERRITELAIVNEIGQAASSAQDMADLLRTVHQQVSQLFDTTNFYIATYEEGGSEWTIAFSVELDQLQPTAQSYSIENGLTGYIIRNRQHLLFQSSNQVLSFHKSQGIKSLGPTAKSWLGVPLIAADKAVGAMGIQSYEHENLYSEQDMALFSTIAAQVAPALDNLRLLEEARRRAQGMEVINEVGQTITSVLDLDAVLCQIVDITKARFGYYYVGIMLVEGNQLVIQSQSTVGDSDTRPNYSITRLNLVHGDGLTIQTVRTEQPVLAYDTLNDPHYLPIPELPDTRCELCLPIRAKGHVIGVLDVQSDQPFAFDQADIALHQSLADQTGAAIENARLFKDAHIHAEELVILNELGQALTAQLGVKQVLNEAYRQASRLVDTTSFYIGLYDPVKHEINFAFVVTDSELDERISVIPADQGFAGYILRNRTSVLLEKDTLEWQKERGIKAIGEHALSFLGVPLITSDQVLGIIAVQSYSVSHLYDKHDQDLLTAISIQVAIALQNAHMFEEAKISLAETEKLVRELAVLNELAQVLTARLSVEQVLDEMYRGVSRLLDTTNFYIGLYDSEKHEIHFALDVSESAQDEHITTISADQGTAGYIIRNRTSVLVHENLFDWFQEKGIEPVGEIALSWMGVPLIIGDRVLGVMAIQSYTTAYLYSEHDRELLTSIASQAAIAIHNAQLYEQAQHEIVERKRAEEEAQRRAAHATLVYEVGQRVSGELELEALLPRIVTSVHEAFDYYSVMMFLLEGHDQLVLQSIAGEYMNVFSADLSLIIGEGMIGYAAATGETQISGDVSQDPHFVRKADETTRSELAAPIKSGKNVVGVLDLQSNDLNAFDETDVILMETLADQIARTIENARLYKETQQRLREQTMLFSASQHLASAPLQAKEIAEIAVRQLAEVMETTVCTFSTLSPQRDSLKALAAFWIESGIKYWKESDTLFRLSDYPSAVRVIKTQHPLVVQASDTASDPIKVAHMREYQAATLALVPVAIKGQTVGIIELETAEERYYTSEQLNMATTLANQTAVAMENARLYEETQQRFWEQTMLFNASHRLASAPLQAREIAEIGVYQLAKVIKATKCSFSLLDPQAGTLTVLANFWARDGAEHWEKAGDSCNLSGYPTAARVMKTLEPMVVQVSDPNTDLAELAYGQKDKTATLALIPLAVKGQSIGVIELETWEERHYTPEQLNIAMTLANQIAVALENAQLYEAMQQELTERWRVERALAYERDLLHALMDNTPDAIYFKDVDSRFMRINKAQAQILGVDDPEQVVGKTNSDFLAEEHAQESYMDEQEIVKTSQPLIDKVEKIQTLNQHTRWVSTTKVPLIDKDGQVAGTIGITRDITERKQAEEQLQRYAAEMARANEEVKRFAYIVSHDLRAPLVNMKGFAAELNIALNDIQSVMETALPHLDEKQTQMITYALQQDAPESLEFIDSAVTRMEHFINALLKLSRLGRRELKLEPVDVNHIVETTLQTLAHQIAAHNGKVTVGSLPTIIADHTSMEQILGNILDNAVKYLCPDRPAQIEITAKGDDDETIFHIQDNGCGISDADVNKVFTPFQRAGKQDVQGEGMGLSYVQALVRRHKGRIWCESKLEAGTTFSFTISNHLKEEHDQ